ncbi:MAG TPA: hypothetical protein VN894_16670, partial [Polyangiaceae bacterium]|nr:hypothetical protein [Polyangiaceae bacterium]
GTDLEVMRRLALEAPPRLDAVMSSAPRALVDLHAQLVARDADKRPRTALDVAENLRAFARSRVSAPDAEAVRSLMYVLFGRQAQSRRGQLTEALHQAAPSRVEELRRSLEPRVLFDQPTSAEPLIVRSQPSAPTLPARSRGPKMPVVLLLVVLGAVAAAFAATRNKHPADAPIGETAAVVRIPTAAIATATTTPITTATTTPHPSATTPAPTTRATARPALVWSSAPPAPLLLRPHPTAQPPPPPTKPPDVDPTPF